MDVNQHQRFTIADRSYLNLVKRDISKLAESYGFSETEIAKINIVVSEIATNLVHHTTQGGEILVKPTGEDLKGIEIISIDRGPGMLDPERMMQDGTSTYGTAGEGLGAIKRQSSFFEYYTTPEMGTVLLVRIFKAEQAQTIIPKPAKLQLGSLMVAKNGETLCGDGWFCQQTEGQIYMLVLDGLGHGPEANNAATKGIESFKNCKILSPADMMRQLHGDIRRTRGAVGAVVRINKDGTALEFCGIGNIGGKIFSTKGLEVSNLKSLISYNGILGHNIPNTVHNQHTDWGSGRMLLLHSDGIKSRVELNRYPDLHRHDPTLIAAVIYRDFNRGTDDTTVIIVKSKN
jgi:anti-sigma regulatory factor (Ser/Thr protein kinase)